MTDSVVDRLTAGPASVVLIGFGAANQAATRALHAHGHRVRATDDRPSSGMAGVARSLSVELVTAPGPARLRRLIREADMVLPTPGLPEGHRALSAARDLDVPVTSELDLARAWDHRPVVAVTGTNGKTTVVEMVVAALETSGIRAVAAGNTGTPMVTAITRTDVDLFVVEASSFRLAHSRCFEPRIGCWLNFAPDHLDVHRDLGSYETAKARIWSELDTDGVAVANRDDPVVMANLPERAVATFSPTGPADWRRDGEVLSGPDGALITVSELGRGLPHDIGNALAAAAVASGAGATPEAIRHTLESFEPTGHRLQPVADVGGVVFYDDSSATTPAATLAAVRALGDPVLIAGGRNKGLDLAVLSDGADMCGPWSPWERRPARSQRCSRGRDRWRSPPAWTMPWPGLAPLAEPGGAVVLSPACASFDRYEGCAQRGEDFIRAVRELGALTAGGAP